MKGISKLTTLIKNNETLLILGLILIGTYLRFYNLNWGVPFLHPDEFNIGLAVSRLQFPQHLNPEFFAYGSFPLYLIYIFGTLWQTVTSGAIVDTLTADQAILIGRYVSATVSVINIYLVYVITKQLSLSFNFRISIVTLCTFLVGLIQYAHFATFESFLTFFYLAISIVSISILTKPNIIKYVLLGSLIGLAIGTKIVSVYLIVLPSIVFILQKLFENNTPEETTSFFESLRHNLHIRLFLSKDVAIALLTALFFFFLTNPYLVLDYTSFDNSFTYERQVADGSLPVFYTRTFLETIPVLFQLQNVLPFISGPLFTIIGSISLLAILFWSFYRVTPETLKYMALMAVTYGYLIIHFSSYVKWTRYMIPIVPFMAITIGLILHHLYQASSRKILKSLLICVNFILVVEIGMRGISFFGVYTLQDTRVEAAAWAAENVPTNATILSEVYDPSILPFNSPLGGQITLINMYDLHTPQPNFSQAATLSQLLEKTDYIILPSRRGYKTALRLPDTFPLNANYYTALFDGSLGFKEVYAVDHNPCVFPKGGSFIEPIRNWLCIVDTYNVEETFVTFDHSSVKILKKVTTMSQPEYYELITN